MLGIWVENVLLYYFLQVKVGKARRDGPRLLLEMIIQPGKGPAPNSIKDGLWEQLLNGASPLYRGKISQHIDVGQTIVQDIKKNPNIKYYIVIV